MYSIRLLSKDTHAITNRHDMGNLGRRLLAHVWDRIRGIHHFFISLAVSFSPHPLLPGEIRSVRPYDSGEQMTRWRGGMHIVAAEDATSAHIKQEVCTKYEL